MGNGHFHNEVATEGHLIAGFGAGKRMSAFEAAEIVCPTGAERRVRILWRFVQDFRLKKDGVFAKDLRSGDEGFRM